jgi:hypothetical protein
MLTTNSGHDWRLPRRTRRLDHGPIEEAFCTPAKSLATALDPAHPRQNLRLGRSRSFKGACAKLASIFTAVLNEARPLKAVTRFEQIPRPESQEWPSNG